MVPYINRGQHPLNSANEFHIRHLDGVKHKERSNSCGKGTYIPIAKTLRNLKYEVELSKLQTDL